MKDINYYNKESSFYSQKRYPKKSTEYYHFLFKKRLNILIDAIKETFKNENDFSILEIGCADGIILRNLSKEFKHKANLIGIDLSQLMVDEANNLANDLYICYLRGRETTGVYDAIVEIGVINFTDFYEEINYTLKNLKSGGYYFCSVAGKSSIINKLKNNREDYSHLRSYLEYENEFRKNFKIISKIPYGYFTPYLWRIPILARIIQPVLDFWCSILFPNLAHEKFFILKKL